MNRQKSLITLAATAAFLGTMLTSAIAVTWSGGAGGTGTSWNDPANWTGGVIPGVGVEAYFNANTGLAAGKILSLDASQSVGQIQFYSTTVDCTLGSASDVSNGNMLSVISVVRAGNMNGTQTFAASVALTDDSAWNIGGGGVGLTVTGSIGGTGRSLTKIGGGLLTLSGNNTYSGGTVVNEGTLALGHANALGTAGTISFGGGTLRLFNTVDLSSRFSQATRQLYNIDTAGQNVAFATPLTSVGGRLAKSGSGTLTLSVPNSYSGTTTISAGTLTFSGTGSLGSTAADLVTSGGTLDLATASPLTVGTLYITGAATIQNGTLTAVGYDANSTGSATISAILAGPGVNLTKANTATLTLANANTYTGTTTVNGGTLALNFNAATAPTSDIINSASTLKMGGGTLTLTGKNSTSLTQTFNGLTLNSGASTFTMTTGNATGSSLMTFGALARTLGATVNFSQPSGNTTLGANNGYVTSTGNNVAGILGGYATVGTTDWAANNGTDIVAYSGYTDLAGATPAIVDGATSNVRVTNGSTGNIGQAGGTVTVNTLLVKDTAARTVTIGTGNTLRLGASGGVLTPAGTGALTLGAPGNAGTLTAGGADSTEGEIVFQNVTTVTNNAVIANNGSGKVALTKSGAGNLVVTTASTHTGGTFVNAGSLFLPGGINPLSPDAVFSIAGGTLDLGGATQTNTVGVTLLGGTVANGTVVGVNSNFNGQAGTVTAVLAGSVGLVKTSSGTLTLTGTSANTYSGDTTILQGNILAGVSSTSRVFIPGNLTVGSPTGGPSASLTVPTNATVWDKLKDLTIYPNGSVNFGGAAQNLGYWTGNAGTTRILGGSLYGGQLYNYRTINMTGGSLGGGVYGGSTMIASVATNTTAVVSAYVNVATTYDVADGVVPIDLLLSGSMGGSSTLTKKGTGTMSMTALGGSSASSATISANGGTLLVNNGRYGSGTGSGAVTVNAGATLGGLGVIGGLVNYTNANVTLTGASGNLATLWPGSKDAASGDHILGTLTVGSVAQTNNVTLGANSKLKINIGTAGKQDRLTVNGVLSLASASDTLELSVDPAAQDNHVYVLASATGGIIGTFNSVTGVPPRVYLVYTATTLELVFPPPPSLIMVR